MATESLKGKEAEQGNIRVATLNLWGRQGDWNARRNVLKEGFKELKPDLIAFQEATRTDEYDQVSDLLGSEYQVIYQRERDEDGIGIAIASRWPLGEVWEVGLHVTPRTADFACGALVAEIQSPIGSLLFVNHLPNWQLNFEHERQLQTVRLARLIEEYVDQDRPHVILAGDLDADPDAGSIRFWSGREALGGMSVCYRDAWESIHGKEGGETFSPHNPLVADWDWPFRRIDYIFVRCGEHGGPTLQIKDCQRIFAEAIQGVWASDHFGLVADLAEPPRSV